MRRDLVDYLIITMVVGLLLVLTTGCADPYVARINSDCRLLPNTTVSQSKNGRCTVCYRKGTAVAACIVTGDADVTPPPYPPEETP